MIISETPTRVNSHWLRACILLCAVSFLSFGTAYAQDFDAVEKRLGRAVVKGELKLEQAAAMMATLRQVASKKTCTEDVNLEKRLEEIGRHLKAAVKAGKLSEEEAWKKWHHIKEKEIAPHIKAAVKAGKMSGEKARAILKGIQQAEIAEKLKAAVAKGELTEKQAKAKWAEISKRAGRGDELADHYKRMGVSVETLGNIKKHLKENGFSDKQIGPTLGGILRVIHNTMRSKGEDSKLDPRLHAFFKKEVGLTDKQIEMVQRVARRILHGIKKRGDLGNRPSHDEMGELGKKIRALIAAGKITKEQARARIEAYRKSHAGAEAKKSREGRKGDRQEAIAKRLKAAVKAGKMTEEEAKAKWKAIEKEAAAKGKKAD